MRLKAHPQAIVADGRSETTISAEVYDSSGRPVADGTLVDFTSSIGTIERSARTTAGVARVHLQSTVNVGTAMVSAVVESGNAVAQLRVDFLEPGTELFNESFITVSSKQHLGYDVGGGIVDSAGGVTIVHRGLTITAEEAQIDARGNVLRAKAQLGGENIVLKRGEKHIEASQIYYDFNSMDGFLITPASDGAKRVAFRGRDLYTRPVTKDDKQVTFDFKPVENCTMFIKARSLIIRPGEEIKIKRASFYLEGDKTVSVPLYVVSLKGDSGSTSQMLTYGTEGLRLDLPLYYSLTPDTTGAFRLRRSDQGGWGYYSTQPGWELDLEQDYNFEDSTEGSFTVNHITSASNWGARWTQRKEIGDDSQLYNYIDFPSHRNLFGSTNYSHNFKEYTLNCDMSASKLPNTPGTYTSDAYLQTHSKPVLGGLVNYSLTSKVSFDSAITNRFGTGLGFQLFGKPIRVGHSGNINTSLIAGHDWGGNNAGTSLMANTGYSTMLGNFGQFGLDYTYSFSDAIFGDKSQRLSFNLNIHPSRKWSAYLYGTRGLTDGNLSAFGQLSYTFLPTWRVDLLGTYQKFGSYTYPDAEIALAKAIGKQEMSIIWSQSQKRFRVEFSALKF